MARYRDKIDKYEIEETDVGRDDFMLAEDVNLALDEIESRVNNVLKDLEKIKGLAEIEDLTYELKLLSEDLY